MYKSGTCAVQAMVRTSGVSALWKYVGDDFNDRSLICVRYYWKQDVFASRQPTSCNCCLS